MTPLARALLATGLLAWPLQALDDGARAWMLAHQGTGAHAAMEVVSSKSRVVLVGGAIVGLVAGPAGRAAVGELALVLVPVNLSVEGLKWLVWRTRPDGDTNRKNSSFPSSHAANAIATAAVLTRRWPRSAVPAWLAASLVAFSRLYLDRHWLSDVLGSAVLGLGFSWLAVVMLKRERERRGAPQTT